jgi:hypothetical protein
MPLPLAVTIIIQQIEKLHFAASLVELILNRATCDTGDDPETVRMHHNCLAY